MGTFQSSQSTHTWVVETTTPGVVHQFTVAADDADDALEVATEVSGCPCRVVADLGLVWTGVSA